ncbi:hypothetical protein ADJ73_13970 [Arsenicicoccus sp. oral taxon 190]|nr:hypothetical protein ADJ73_13970 [Arsenicicoccus sp. oral taxon 190]
MPGGVAGGVPVAPHQLLDARDRRVARRRALQAAHPGPGVTVVAVTLVVPGPVKTSPTLEAVRDDGVRGVIRVCALHRWRVLARAAEDAPSGPEALLAVAARAGELKQALVHLEDHHPIGRLWDLDVFAGNAPLGRADLGLGPRRCLVCEQPAHACARSRAHPLDQLTTAVEVLGARRQP